MLNAILKKQFLSALDKTKYGSLFLSLPDGGDYYLSGDQPGPHADLHIMDWSVIRDLASRGDVGFADAYREGKWETNSLEELFAFALQNDECVGAYSQANMFSRVREQFAYLFRKNSLKGSKRNIQEHYDLGNEFYSIWLDPTMTYSSAIFNLSAEELSTAQLHKYDRLIDKIEDTKGSILEIGCGWGGFAERAASRTNCSLKGLTLSQEQLTFAEKRLSGQASFALQDYRQEKGLYDTIVSIEMFEAVGMRYWNQYFNQISNRLKRGGKALVQSITIENERFESYRKGSDMIRSYIFPGGMLPSDEKFTQAAMKSGLRIRDRFAFGKDYARTLRHWLSNFEGSASEIRELGFDDGFMRLWRYYLASCAASFENGRIDVLQYEMVHS